MKKRLFTIILLSVLPSVVFAYENLTELEARTSRKGTNTFYSGEDSGNSYIWQPQIVIYQDDSTDHEVWVWSQTANANTFRTAIEYGMQPWSADGKRIAFVQEIASGAYTRSTGYPWYVARSDGSYWRPVVDTANRTDVRRFYYNWSPIIQDIAYTIGYNANGVTGQDENGVYRETHTDTSESSSLIVDLIGADTTTELLGNMKGAITGDGLYFITSDFAETEPFYIVRVEPSGSRALELTYNQPALDTYWTNTPSDDGHYHDECFTGNSAHGYFIYFLYTSGSWWRMRPWGSDSGTPNHVTDNSSEYDWWEADAQASNEWSAGLPDANKELQPVNGAIGTMPDFVGDYWSHGMCDRWGTHMVYSDTDNTPVSPGVFDVDGESQVGLYTTPGGTQYHAWTGYTDYTAQTCGSTPTDMCSLLYNSTTNSDHITVANLHSATVNEFTKPGQSPDGTKISMRSDWLNSGSGTADLFIGVAYFPYPPEVTACTASGGTITTSFNWRTDQVSPRTYATRGWPNESTDDPPPPRETEFFRLWRCSGTCTATSGTWTPLGTVNADIFSRYDFSDGTWESGYSATSTWSITDSPGDGTWYYAITSKEWSGLESHALSNIYSITVTSGSGTGSQNVAYPSSPGDLDNISTSDFHSSFSTSAASIVRAYNIYANDGSAPSVQQQDLIATIPVSHCSGGSCEWVDWLGNTSGTTEYIIAAVDSQGNISGSSYVTTQAYEHCGGVGDCSEVTPEPTANGQYRISWDDMYAANAEINATFKQMGTATISNQTGTAVVFNQ